MRSKIVIAGDRHLETLGNCGGYYACPKDSDGRRLGPLVGYAGTYETDEGQRLQFVGDIYANFAKAEPYPNVLKFFAGSIACRLDAQIDITNIDVFCGAPIGGYSLADALGLENGICMIKAEKKVIALKTPTSREKSELVFSRHGIEQGKKYVIVEDVCNNFSTTADLVKLIIAGEGEVVAIACFLNRSLEFNRYYKFLNYAIPIISLVRMPIREWKQDDPAVAEDVANGNVVWKPKNEWDRLMQAMKTAG